MWHFTIANLFVTALDHKDTNVFKIYKCVSIIWNLPHQFNEIVPTQVERGGRLLGLVAGSSGVTGLLSGGQRAMDEALGARQTHFGSMM